MSEAAQQAGELESLIGTTLAGSYRVDSLLGVGGMGAVFQAHHLLLKRDVAVKVLHPELLSNEDMSKRFDREAQSAARLDHPNIIPVTEFGSTDDGMKYMVMQLLSGQELGDLLTGPLDPLRAIELEVQILRGLEHAHANGVIHRDLKPENVFVTQDHDGDEILKLVDFGIAKIVDEDVDDETVQPLTRMGLVFGTPHYMSPEQATGSEIDQRTDVYSAGVMLYQMLAGEVPFDHEDPVSLIRMQVSLDPPPLPASVPETLAQVVSTMMAKGRDQRYPNARAARKALQAVHSQLAAEAGVPVAFNPEDTGIVDPRDIYGPGGVPSDSHPRAGTSPGAATVPVMTAASPGPAHGPGPSSGPEASFVDKVVAQAKELYAIAEPRVLEFIEMVKENPRKWGPILGGGALGFILLIVLIGSLGGDDEDEPSESDTGAAVATKTDEPKADTEEAKHQVDEDTLIAIDQALTGGDSEAALELIRPALDENPENTQLLWREGKARAMKRSTSSKVTALERYAAALEGDPKLIEDPNFYGELYDLLRNSKLQEQAIDLAVQKLGESGHTFLLELVNVDNPKKVLGWVDRHRVLNELESNEDSFKRVDRRLNLARDLYQAKDAPKPCAAFADTLDAVGKAKDVYFVEHIFNAKLEPPSTEDSENADAATCQELGTKLEIVRAAYRVAFAEETAKYTTTKKKKKR